jgi:hypothetical protein
MTNKDLYQFKRDIEDLIKENKIKDALDVLEGIVSQLNDNELINTIILKKSEFGRLEKLSLQGTDYREELKIDYNRLIFSILTIKDIAIDKFENENAILSIKSFDKDKELKEFLANFSPLNNESVQLNELIVAAYKKLITPFETRVKNNGSNKYGNISFLFDEIVGNKEIDDNLTETILKIRRGNQFLWQDRSIVVSALGISSITHYSESKIVLLFDFVSDFEDEVWQRAFVGLILSFGKFNNKWNSSQKILNKIEFLKGNPIIQNAVEVIEMLLRRKTYDYSHLFSSLPDEVLSGLYKNINHDVSLNQSQFQGIRNYISANGLDLFSLGLSQSEFFSKPMNWFMPFYLGNEVSESVKSSSEKDIDIDSFMNGLQRNLLLDNIDKYLICLNFENLNPEKIDWFMNLSNLQDDILSKATDSIGTDKEWIKHRLKFSQVIRELFRFIKMVDNKLINELNLKISLSGTAFFEKIVSEPIKYKIMANMFFANNLFSLAADHYSKYMEVNNNDEQVISRIAWCFFELGQFDHARVYYLKITDKLKTVKQNALLNLGHIELCRGNVDTAIIFYRQSLKLSEKLAFSNEFINDFKLVEKYHITKEHYLEILKNTLNDLALN